MWDIWSYQEGLSRGVIEEGGGCHCCLQQHPFGKLEGASDVADRGMCVYLQVARHRMRALIDSGACRSLLYLDAWRNYCMKTGRGTRLRKIPKGITLRSLSKQEIPTRGLAVVNVYDVDVQFHVVSSLSHD